MVNRPLKLTRFRGHPNICVQGVHDGEDETTLHTGIPSSDGRAGPRRPLNWVGQTECDAGRGGNGLTTAEREELTQLRRENRQLRLERDILSKAAAWFARETNTIPSNLAAKGIRVGRKRVARLMSAAGLVGVSRRKFVPTTVKGSGRQAPDLVDRNARCGRS
jgi:HTH-like domain